MTDLPASRPRRPAAPMARRTALLGLAAAASGVSGCTAISPLGAVTKAPALYRLTPKSMFETDAPAVSLQIVVDEPMASASVNTDRIAISPHPFRIEYYPDVRWVDRAPVMVQSLLLESFSNSGKAPAVENRATGLGSDLTLLSELREFQAELPEGAGSDAAPSVRVQLNLKLVVEPQGLIVAAQTFERVAKAEGPEILQVVEAFDDVLGKCVRRAVEWTLREAAEIEKRPRG